MLDAGCDIDTIDGQPFSEVFRNFVLGDPEVDALAKEAIKVFPDAVEIFSSGSRNCSSSQEWSVTSPDPTGYANLGKAVRQQHGIPDELVIAVKALTHRWHCLLGRLRRGEWIASGISEKIGNTIDLLRSLWMHPDFYLDPMAADLLEIYPRHGGMLSGYRKHSTALILRRAPPPQPMFQNQQGATSAWRRTKIDEVRAALGRANIDVLETPLTSKEIERKISSDLPFPLASETGFAKMLGRIRKQARSVGE